MRQFGFLLAGALPSTLVCYALGALLIYKLRLTKATKIVGFFVAWLVTAITAVLMADKPTVFSAQQEMFHAGFIGAIVVIALLWITRIVRVNITDKGLKSESHHDKRDNKSQPIDNETYSDEKYYSIALKEIQVNHLSSGLWGKALAYSDGDQDKAKAYYLKERAKQLMQRHQEKLNESTETFTPIIESDKKPISPNDIALRANDLYSQGRYAEALPLVLQLAEQNYASWQLRLGYMYNQGQGAAQDNNLAFYWYNKAAEQDDSD